MDMRVLKSEDRQDVTVTMYPTLHVTKLKFIICLLFIAN